LLAATPTAESHYLRGKCLLRLARWEEAAGSFRRSLELKPRYAEALYSLGDALRRLGRADASRAALMEFEKVHREEQERLRKADRLSQKLLRSPGDAATAEEDLRLLLEKQKGLEAPAGGLLFNCNGRGTRMYPEPCRDISATRQIFPEIPIAGFFAAGELGPVGRRNFVHGHTASFALFRPRRD